MTADLIINSGIQFIAIPINLNEDLCNRIKLRFSEEVISETHDKETYSLKEVYHWKDEDIFIDKDSINSEAYSNYGELDPSRINSKYVIEIDEEDVYSVSGKEALQICEKHWIPIPYFRLRRDIEMPFHHGPENWCRMNIQPEYNEEKGTTHVLVLAFDTNAESNDDPNYYRVKERDASDSGNERFKCVIEKRHAPKFFTSQNLWDWLFNLYWIDDKNARSKPQKLRHIAIYYTILELLNSIDAFPEIGLLTGQSEERPIEVGLTLDIGNSRTCGLLVEKSRPFESQPFDFTSARKLQIRNLSAPNKVYDEPFEMQVAFAQEKFGNSASDLYDNVFSWPSLVRVGTEAVELTSFFESEDSQATISSPKRYLWDKKPVKIPWIKVDIEGRMGFHDGVHKKEKALYGIGRYLTDNGRLKSSDGFGAEDSRYSRSSIMMFSIYEILLHAISQINNPEFRRDQGNSTYRRVLKDIVITCPTAMTVQEQYILRKSVIDAADLIQKTMGDKIDFEGVSIEVFPELPSLEISEQKDNPWKLDEAMCSQLAYLYGELIHKYSSNEKIFFDLNGKIRNNSNNKSVTIASIDIGGGTTDLMISNYEYDETSEVPFLKPNPIFWEGFSLAGDDIVKRIIEKEIIPAIINDIEVKGGKNVVGVINELFGQNIGGQSAIEKIYRKQFANLVGTSTVYKIFKHLTKASATSHSFFIKEVFEDYERPKSKMIPYINKKISLHTGISDYDIQDVMIQVDTKNVNSGIIDVIGDVLKQLSFLVSHFDCDLLLLSGRPSRLPIITEIVTSTFNFSPNIVVNLGDYRFGNWYPFADSTGYVYDPKSTVCVGSLIAYLNNISRLPGLRFDFTNMDKIQTTAKFIGVIKQDRGLGRIENENIIFSPEQSEGQFRFYGEPVPIGMKQLKSEDWISTSLYIFDFRDDERKKQLTENHNFPYLIKFNRTQSEGEFIDKEDIEITDANGILLDNYDFDFSLRTSNYFQLHWKDSGSFITPIV